MAKKIWAAACGGCLLLLMAAAAAVDLHVQEFGRTPSDQPHYGYYDNQQDDQRYGYNAGYQSPPSNNNYGRPYPPPGYRSNPPYAAQSPNPY